MQKPDLNKVWETFIEIPNLTRMLEAFRREPTRNNLAGICNRVVETIRVKLYPMISKLTSNGTIGWYCFLIHPSRRQGDPNRYLHVRFELLKDIKDKERVNNLLPDYCKKEMTERFMDVEPDPENISGIDKSLLKNKDIQEVWRIAGEQSEWLMNMLNIHKENVEIPIKQIIQFMHYYLNMLGLGHRGRLILNGEILSF